MTLGFETQTRGHSLNPKPQTLNPKLTIGYLRGSRALNMRSLEAYGSLCADLRFVEQNMEELQIHYQSGLNEWSYSISVFILRIQQIMYDKTLLKLYKVPRPQTLSPGA